ncbi:hypothetical protein RF11_08181 [Thelohanellus kitauei]|uniref:Uncharacterized protein n=1 Tax=Thelohanellus kitauei TaxID=669202 RepID=A0A0C2NIF5_THEKT|nr:hypothetical protein RF11_08181 [Thelohanellus kitauei]
MFIRENNKRAFQCYRDAIDVYVEHGKINEAIQNCFEYGYNMGKKSCFTEQMHELYALGDRLRVQRNLSHSCGVTEVKISDYENDFIKVSNDLSKFDVEEETDGNIFVHQCNLFCLYFSVVQELR